MLGALSACSATINQNGMIKRVVRSERLSNGQVLNIGHKAPAASLHCKTLGSESHNWALSKTEGMVKMGGGYQQLQDAAVSYANQHKNVNYAFIDIPNEYNLGAINLTMLRKATITYYQCEVPPAVNHNPF